MDNGSGLNDSIVFELRLCAWANFDQLMVLIINFKIINLRTKINESMICFFLFVYICHY